MASDVETQELVRKYGWLIVDFNLKESNLGEFMQFLEEYILHNSPKDPENLGRGLLFTLDRVVSTPIIMVHSKLGAIINIVGYEVYQGTQKFNNELIMFSVRPTPSDLVSISGTPQIGLIPFFLDMLQEISKRWAETTPEIVAYRKRIKLIIKSWKLGIKQENIDLGKKDQFIKPKTRQRRPRRAVVERVAVAILAHEKGDIPTLGSAAKRYGTQLRTIKSLINYPPIIEIIKNMRDDPRYADKIKRHVVNDKKGITGTGMHGEE